MTDKEKQNISFDCYDCQYHICNDDTGMYECQGEENICHEFILSYMKRK
jgi:hypothetical protein